MIRRQMRMDTRKPQVVMTPKSLLRHKPAVSSLDEFAKGSFQHLIPDTTSDPKKAKRVVLSSGEVYYDLPEDMPQREADDAALTRDKQTYPYPRAHPAAARNHTTAT